MNAPAVSVLICSRNRLRYLKLALRSVQAQTFRDFEIVLADESDDGTREWIERRGPKGLRYLRLPRGRGLPAARNRAVASARGEFVAFLDSDDLWHPAYLETVLRRLQDPAVLACACGFRRIDERGRDIGPSGLRPRGPADSLMPAVIGMRFVPAPSASIFRKSVFAAVGGFDEELSFCLEDTDFIMRVGLELGPAALDFLDLPLVSKRSHREQKTTRLHGFGRLVRDLRRAGRPPTRLESAYLRDWLYFSAKHRQAARLIGAGLEARHA